jgi:hypothetical protein
MRVSVIAADNVVVVDGKPMQVDCKSLRDLRISAIQWYDDHGEVEFDRHHKPNETMKDYASLKKLIDAAKPFPSPKAPTPAELLETHNRYMLEHPDARKAWDEYDAEQKRLADEVRKREGLEPLPWPYPELPKPQQKRKK